MRFEHVNHYAAAPDTVLGLLTTAEFREEVCRRQHALRHTVQVEGAGVGATVEIRQTQSLDKAPGFAKKVVGSSVDIVQRERWESVTGAEFAMEIPGKPGSLRGRIAMRDNGDGTCDEVFSGDVTVQVPLVGRKLEGFVADILAKALRREGEVGASWLAEGRG